MKSDRHATAIGAHPEAHMNDELKELAGRAAAFAEQQWQHPLTQAEEEIWWGFGDTVSLAVCRAALKAVGA